ncbi:MAG: hypothetical protein K9L68_01400 [Spirochaetales bacterium]|nr:hypothetical protein [Spirochaetales bacterium]
MKKYPVFVTAGERWYAECEIQMMGIEKGELVNPDCLRVIIERYKRCLRFSKLSPFCRNLFGSIGKWQLLKYLEPARGNLFVYGIAIGEELLKEGFPKQSAELFRLLNKLLKDNDYLNFFRLTESVQRRFHILLHLLFALSHHDSQLRYRKILQSIEYDFDLIKYVELRFPERCSF